MLTKKLLFEKTVGDTTVRVVETETWRSLWINKTEQSRMLLQDHHCLITPYEQAMAAWQLFLPSMTDHDQVIMLGLGGGSAAKHCYAQYPNVPIQVIEQQEAIAYIAYDYFALPRAPSLNVMIDDALKWVVHPNQTAQATLLYVDLFSAEINAVYQYNQAFFEGCLKCMGQKSVLVINLWATDQEAFKTILQTMGHVFAWRLLVLPVEGSGNVVVFAFPPDGEKYNHQSLQASANALSQTLQLPMDTFLSDLIRHNKAQLELCLTM